MSSLPPLWTHLFGGIFSVCERFVVRVRKIIRTGTFLHDNTIPYMTNVQGGFNEKTFTSRNQTWGGPRYTYLFQTMFRTHTHWIRVRVRSHTKFFLWTKQRKFYRRKKFKQSLKLSNFQVSGESITGHTPYCMPNNREISYKILKAIRWRITHLYIRARALKTFL